MTVFIEAGYVLPGGDEPLSHARIAHAKNWIQGDISGTSTADGYFLAAPNNALSYEKWKATADKTIAPPVDWATTGCAIALDVLKWARVKVPTYRLVEDSATSIHSASYTMVDNVSALKYSAVIWVHAVGTRNVSFKYVDASANEYSVVIDLTNGTTVAALNAAATTIDKGDGWWLVNMTFTSLTSSKGTLTVGAASGTAISYAGDGNSGITYSKPLIGRAKISWQVTPLLDETVDYCCISGHNMADWGGELRIQYDDGAGGYATAITRTVYDNSPIYCILAPRTVGYYRVRSVNSNPHFGTIRFGKSLQLPRPFLGGHSPIEYGRMPVISGNVSETGATLGRSKRRTKGEVAYKWQNIDYTWIDSNLIELQDATEIESFFVAWRPDKSQGVAYGSVADVPRASFQGQRDLMDLSFDMRTLGDE